MDELLLKALQRIDALEAELTVLRSFVDSYRRTVAHREVPAESPDLMGLMQSGQATKKQRSEFWKMVISEAKNIIIQFGRPMTRGELADIIEKKGIPLPGKDKVKVFGTNLWRSGEFLHFEGRGYWPKEHSLEGQPALIL
jgi:hypothetical protein